MKKSGGVKKLGAIILTLIAFVILIISLSGGFGKVSKNLFDLLDIDFPGQDSQVQENSLFTQQYDKCVKFKDKGCYCQIDFTFPSSRSPDTSKITFSQVGNALKIVESLDLEVNPTIMDGTKLCIYDNDKENLIDSMVLTTEKRYSLRNIRGKDILLMNYELGEIQKKAESPGSMIIFYKTETGNVCLSPSLTENPEGLNNIQNVRICEK